MRHTKVLIPFLSLLLSPLLLQAQPKALHPSLPNILVLMADDWSWPHAGALGDTTVKTPTFDQLASEGVLFENAFVSAPSCTPSRFAIATGQHHWRLGSAANLGGSLRKDVPVYPELLKDKGYKIGFSRKGAAPSKHEFTGRDPFGNDSETSPPSRTREIRRLHSVFGMELENLIVPTL